MDEKRFWDIIAFACKPGQDNGQWYEALVGALMQLPPEGIVGFDRLFEERVDRLDTPGHSRAAYLINGGGSDDGFYYFRCWVVALGKASYEAIVADPDALADVIDPTRFVYEAWIASAGVAAWRRQGLAEDEFYQRADSQRIRVQPEQGDAWDFDDDELFSRLPRLAAMYIQEDDDNDEDEATDEWE